MRHKTQFNIIHPASGLKIDVIIMRDTAFDKSRLARRRRSHPAPAYKTNFATPEDVLKKQMQYYVEGSSEKRFRDIAGVLMIGGEEIDRSTLSPVPIQLRVADRPAMKLGAKIELLALPATAAGMTPR